MGRYGGLHIIYPPTLVKITNLKYCILVKELRIGKTTTFRVSRGLGSGRIRVGFGTGSGRVRDGVGFRIGFRVGSGSGF